MRLYIAPKVSVSLLFQCENIECWAVKNFVKNVGSLKKIDKFADRI